MNELQRFEALHIKVPELGCWIWMGAVNDGGYPVFKTNGKQVYAHRWAHECFNGPLWQMDALHRCDVPCCVNPAHLYAGTHVENMRDRQIRGRTARGKKHGMFNNGHKITLEIAERIRSSPLPQEKIASYFGVSRQLVGLIRQNKRWVRRDANQD